MYKRSKMVDMRLKIFLWQEMLGRSQHFLPAQWSMGITMKV